MSPLSIEHHFAQILISIISVLKFHFLLIPKSAGAIGLLFCSRSLKQIKADKAISGYLF